MLANSITNIFLTLTSYKEQIEVKQSIFQPPILTPFLILSVSFFLFAVDVLAESVDALQWEITADRLTRYEEPASVIAEGTVILEKKEPVPATKEVSATSKWNDLLGDKSPESGDVALQGEEPEAGVAPTEQKTKTITTIRADWVIYDVDLGRVKARGNVQIDIGTDKLIADSGFIDLAQETGNFTNATIIRQDKAMHLEGRVLAKTGHLTYRIEDGWIITCKLKEGETPPWSFGSADTEITDDGYAYLKHATFRIKDVPVLYSPYMVLPAKRKRQTGFLFPAISSSDRDGLGFEIPFFINLADSSDMTLYQKYMEKRGLMMGGEFRYVADQFDKGTIMANYLSDDQDDTSDGQYTTTNKDRYWLRGKADHDIGKWVTRIDFDLVSDKDYLMEFDTGMTGFDTSHDRFLDVYSRGFQNKSALYRENSIEVLRSWDNGTALQANMLAIDDLSDPQETPSRLWKLPSLQLSGLMPLDEEGRVDFFWDVDYVHYWREQGVGANRFDLRPELEVSVPLSDYLETTVSAGVRDTFYIIQVNGEDEANPDNFNNGDTENRLVFDLGAEIGTTLMGDFDLDVGSVYSMSHAFRPFVAYDYISDDDQDDLPDFDTIDRIADKNIIYYGVDNFFDIFGEIEGRKYGREAGYLKIKQGYDLRGEESDTPWTQIDVKMVLNPSNNLRLKYVTEIGVYGEGMYSHIVEADLKSSRGDILSADYKYNDLTDTESVKADVKVILPYNFSVQYGIERSIEDDRTIEEEFLVLYEPTCWSIGFYSQYTPGNQTYMLTFRLANIGSPLELAVPSL